MKIRGADVLIGKLKENANMDDVKNAVKLNGSEMHKAAQRYAPVDTGYLRRNINYYSEDNGFTARVKSGAEYAGYQEFGTRYQPGTPHVRPAFHNQENQFKKDIQRLMK